MSSPTRTAAAANRRATGGTGRNGRYDGIAILLHWALALLIPSLVGLGWYMLSIEKDPGSAWFLALHISLGLTAAFLIALRVVWRRSHRPPLLPWVTPAWEASAARLGHAVLYGLMVLMPITGYLGASFSGHAIRFFGVPLPGWAGKNDALKDFFFQTHSVIAWVLVAVVSLHVAGALKHLLVDKDDVFPRMWPR